MINRSCARSVLFSFGALAILAADRNASASIRADGYTNSATVGDGIVFDELNVNFDKRRANDKPAVTAATIADPSRGTIPVRLAVTTDRLSATEGSKTYLGKDLQGLTITIAMCDGREYELYLNDVRERVDMSAIPVVRLAPSPLSQFWVPPFTGVESYDFLVRKTSRRKPISRPCPGSVPPVDDSLDGPVSTGGPFKEHLCKGRFRTTDDLWTGYEFALAFEGDYFDPGKEDQLTVQADGWFNLACAGTAAAKMHLLRHTEAGQDKKSRLTTTTDQRTTMLKAITADYCGDGGISIAGADPRVWTGDGTPLFWTDDGGWFPDGPTRADGQSMLSPSASARPLPGPQWEVEAIWGPQGAMCLGNYPRRRPGPTATCPDQRKVPAVDADEVRAYCAKIGHSVPMPCSSSEIAAFWAGKKGQVITLNTMGPADYCRY